MRPSRASFLALSILLVLAAVGVAWHRDYGASWDEPLFYEYAANIREAYSLSAYLEQKFSLDEVLASTEYDHRFYGPAYLLIGSIVVDLLSGTIHGIALDHWHLVNFLTFLTGGAFLFCLSRKWMSTPAALSTMILYVLQPVLWGHGFMNPKDIPFTTFFIAAIFAGYGMVETASANRPLAGEAELGSGGQTPGRRRWHLHLTLLLGFGLALVLLILWQDAILALVEHLVRFSYGNPEGLPGAVLRIISPNVHELPVEAYLRRASIIALRAKLLLLCGAAAGLAIVGVAQLHHAQRRLAAWTIVAGLFLGLATSIRVLGPLAGALVGLYATTRLSRRNIVILPFYAGIAIAVAYATWPYLWATPIGNFLNVLRHMAGVPETLPVLFAGRVFSSESLPADYLPRLMLLTLTEPTIILATLGGLSLARHRLARPTPANALLPIMLWIALPLGYVVATSQPMYDGYRHFLFILPPLFILAGLGLDYVFDHSRSSWIRGAVVCLSVAPGALGVVLLHPYEYTYFNAVSGGMEAASRQYETDYWLTCYREAMRSPALSGYETVFVYRQPSLAALYASPGTSVRRFDPDSTPASIPANSALLLTTRANSDLTIQPGKPIMLEVSRLGAPYCVVKSLNPEQGPQRDWPRDPLPVSEGPLSFVRPPPIGVDKSPAHLKPPQ